MRRTSKSPRVHAFGRLRLNAGGVNRLLMMVLGVCAVLVVLVLFLKSRPREQPPAPGPDTAAAVAEEPSEPKSAGAKGSTGVQPARSQREEPGQTVQRKIREFARGRREVARALAREAQGQLDAETERFFDALEGGRWGEAREVFEALKNRKMNEESTEVQQRVWPAVQETYGVADTAQNWPPEQLLAYGNSILGSLRPGMVYLGGTEAGRFIPTLLNETSGGEKHVVLSQSALADFSYLQYAQHLYGQKLVVPQKFDSEVAFRSFMAHAQARLEHDAKFPDEPKQVRPGENLQSTDGRFHASGETAVMEINERLLKALLQNNPNVSFAIEESFPFQSIYAEAVPLGPIMELRAQNADLGLTPDTAQQVIQEWRAKSEQVKSNPDLAANPEVAAAWAKMAAAHANLLAGRDLPAEAEAAFQVAQELAPGTPQAAIGYANLLVKQQRGAEAIPILQRALENAPDNAMLRDVLQQLQAERK
jgi:tetratricopeptide (TPR) repeat protein